MLQQISKLTSAVLPELVTIRRALHQHPELACREYRTADFVRRRLRKLGLRVSPPFLKTDVVALLKTRQPGINVTLRADMDGLPLSEKNNLPYRSQTRGVMHACGHDGHVAMLLGAAFVLTQLKERLHGTVRFVFQPGEEVAAAGRDLVAAGALCDPAPAAVLALHAWNQLPVGCIASRPGVFLAAADVFKITVRGKGGHGSRPDTCVNPLPVAAQVIQNLQAIPSQKISALEPVVISVCRVAGGNNANVIPESAEIEGSVRYFDAALAPRIRSLIEQILQGVCLAAGASYELKYDQRYLPTRNDRRIVALGERVARTVLGPTQWRRLATPGLGSEDFSYYLKEYPGAMFRIGVGTETPELHSPYFDFNDDALMNGVVFLVHMTIELLGRQTHLRRT